MKIQAFILSTTFCFVFAASSSYAASGAGTEGASFLNIPVGAEPAALGGAYSSLSSNAYAPVWNPGGLGQVEGNELAAQHLIYLESIRYEFASFVHPFSPGHAFGASVQYLGTGDIASTDVSGNSIGSIKSHYGAYSLAYGQALTSKLSLGLTGKFIEAKLADEGATAFALSLGTQYRASEKWVMAGTVNNIGSKMKFIDQKDSLPADIRLGGAYRGSPKWTLSVEGVYAQTGLASLHTGLEWRPVQEFSLRGGYRTDTIKELGPLAGLTLGAGFNVMGQTLSYAWVPFDELGNTHYISFLIRFNKLP